MRASVSRIAVTKAAKPAASPAGAASAAAPKLPTVPDGFNIEAATLAPGGGSTILLGFRAPLQNTTLRNLDSFKVPKLTCLLERFRGSEWTARVNEYTNDSPNKDVHFEQRIPETGQYHEFTLNVSIYAYVKSDSPLCRIVVTGVTERVVREEVKQIVCA